MSKIDAIQEIQIKRHLAKKMSKQAHKIAEPKIIAKLNVFSQQFYKQVAELESYFKLEKSLR